MFFLSLSAQYKVGSILHVRFTDEKSEACKDKSPRATQLVRRKGELLGYSKAHVSPARS